MKTAIQLSIHLLLLAIALPVHTQTAPLSLEQLLQETSLSQQNTLPVKIWERGLEYFLIAERLDVFTASDWTPNDSITYSYDAENRTLEVYTRNWDGNTWVDDRQTLFTHQANGSFTSTTSWWNNESWVPLSKRIETLDGNGNVIEIANQFWQYGSWWNNNRTTYTYSPEGLRTTSSHFSGNGGLWVPESQTLYTYDTTGKLEEELYQQYNSLTDEYEPTSQKNYTYNAAGLVSLTIEQNLNNGTATNYRRNFYDYNLDGNPILRIVDFWVNDAWLPEIRVVDEFDFEGLQVASYLYLWDELQSIWNYFYQYTFENDENGNRIWQTRRDFNEAMGQWEYKIRTRYYYEQFTVSTQETNATKVALQVFPNPNQGQFQVTFQLNEATEGTLTLLDALGRVHDQRKLVITAGKHTEPLTYQALSAGLYLLHWTDGKQQQSLPVQILD